MTVERISFRTVILALVVISVASFFEFRTNKYIEAEKNVESHRDCMDKTNDGVCCNMTPPDFVEYHKARRLLEGERY